MDGQTPDCETAAAFESTEPMGSEGHGWQGRGLTPENRERCVRSHNGSITMKILMVLTSHDQLGNTGRKTGFWLEEFAAPYFVFKDAGVELTLASPKGGQPPLDPKSDLPENQTPAMTRFKKDKMAQQALANTVTLSSVNS